MFMREPLRTFNGVRGSSRVCPEGRIGGVPQGMDAGRVIDFLRSYRRFFGERWGRFWATRLCEKCVNYVRVGGEYSEERADKFYQSKRRNIENPLAAYCEIRETGDGAFDWTERVILE
jgi:hypothetical protein